MAETIPNDRRISLQEVCNYLGVKRHTVMRWIDQRGMPASKPRWESSGVSKPLI
jgi:excisionase family DNA binding protein